jgi:hypothetical protein
LYTALHSVKKGESYSVVVQLNGTRRRKNISGEPKTDRWLGKRRTIWIAGKYVTTAYIYPSFNHEFGVK